MYVINIRIKVHHFCNNKYKAQEAPTKVYFALRVLFVSTYPVWQDEINNERTKAV